LTRAILEYINVNDRMELEGFMNFRAETYKKELKKVVAAIVNEYVLEQEQKGFILLLKKYIESKKPVYPTINLIIKKDGAIAFLDEKGCDISKECLEENYSTVMDSTFLSIDFPGGTMGILDYYEDLIISALIKCAPRKVVIHMCKEKFPGLLNVLKEVFKGKIIFCTGCILCCKGN